MQEQHVTVIGAVLSAAIAENFTPNATRETQKLNSLHREDPQLLHE